MVTLEDVAARAGVSRALVSLVIRGAPGVSHKSRNAVMAVAAELGYHPNLIARQLASSRTATIGVLLSDLHNPVFAETAEFLDGEARRRGYRLLIGTGFRQAAREREAVESFLGFRVNGVILCGTTLPSAYVRSVAERVPLVAIGRSIPGVDVVATDNELGARLAVEHLIGLGHRRIAHIDGGRGAGAPLRRATYLAVMREHGLEREAKAVPGNYTAERGEAAARQLLGDRVPPSAIFAANDLCASGVLQVAYQLGVAVPAQLSVVGFDNTVLARAGYISLTTIAQLPRDRTATAAVDLLLEQFDGRPGGSRRVLFPPSLVVRCSSAAPCTG